MYTLITGATGGIGKAFAVECAKSGYKLFLTGRSQDKLDILREELSGYTNDIVVYPCNLEDEVKRQALFDFADELNIKFDRLINVAGIDIQKPFIEYTQDKIIRQTRVNFEAAVCLTKEVLSRREGGLEIITISSMSGITPMPYFALYSATKKALTQFFKALRIELKGCGVKITTVLQGSVPTRPDVIENIKSHGLFGKISAKSPEYVAKKSLQKVRKNKAVFVPGGMNKVLRFMMALVPEPLKLKFIAKKWKKTQKDAF